ncbi:MAG: DUF222 domain-containing protein [Gammaproteobacteria bacterium]|nr:DUF222 domain-containing protein [Gammaproteobacteria bacterium]
MIASANVLYDTHRRLSPWPAMVREPTGARTVSTDAIPAHSGPENAPNRAAGDGDDDELRRLGERIAELAARINSAEARMMTLIAEFDRRGGWKDGGYSSCAEWLAWRIGTKIGTARERVRTARALERLPQTADALKHGTISYAKVRALTRVATPEREAELLEFARAGSAAKLERTVRMLKKLSRDAELTAEQARRRSRTFSVFVDGDGMYVVKGRLEPEAGAVLMRAVEAASDALFRREKGAGSGSHEGDAQDAAGSGRRVSCGAGSERPEPKQRRADAMGLLAERALAAGFGAAADRDASRPIANAAAPEPPSVDEGRASFSGEGQTSFNGDGQASPNGEERTSSHGDPSTASRVGSGTRTERYQVMVHCDAATLAAEGEPGRSDLDAIRVSAETSRRMACDAAVVAMVHAKDGSMLNVGRRTRTIPPHIRRALEERDRGCRFPGCGCRFTEAHHVKHWADGGETSLRNTLLLCRRHHRAVHEGRVKVSVNGDGTVLFFTPEGRMLVDAPSRPKAARGGERPGLPPVPTIHPGAPAKGGDFALSNGAALYHDSEVPWEIEAAAREALDESLETDPRKRE